DNRTHAVRARIGVAAHLFPRTFHDNGSIEDAMNGGVVMRTKTSELAVSGLTLSAALAICGTAAVAQEAEQVLDEIIVEAPWRVEREVVGRSASGAPIEEITLTRRIDISDLDLSQTADVGELETRIDDIASDSCDRLAEMFPLEDTDTRGCVDDAT